MTANFRAYISGVLALVLVLTGHSMAIARGMPGVAGYAEYCIGENPVMVPVDADGNPTGAPHLCPDFSASLLTWIAVPEATIEAHFGQSRIARLALGDHVEAIRQTSPSARAPPIGVFIF
ncbi:hypothetical protein [Shimia sp.]|uniref:hypothetical protein n=1 Tax=Shimia sp. TaxID=1954381 RepID=UPI003BA8E7E9